MIFVWIPKTGGTSFAKDHPNMQVVTENYADHVYKWHNDEVSYGHACPKKLLRFGIIEIEAWQNSYKVAIVRDPYARFVSLFHDYKRTGRIPVDFTQLNFIRAIIEMDPKPDLYNSYRLSMCAPQVEWLIPGINILRFEDCVSQFQHKENAGNYTSGIDEEARGPVFHFYRADFVALNYDT